MVQYSSSSSTSSSNNEEKINDLESDLYEAILLHSKEIMAEYERRCRQKKRKRRRYIERNGEGGHEGLFRDYFAEIPVYPDYIFRRRFRMRRDLFIRIVSALENHSPFFQKSYDAVSRQSLSPIQKCTAAIRQLAYGVPVDQLDEYLGMGKSTATKCLTNFCQSVIEIWGSQYLRRPNAADIERLTQMHSERHGFPGMLGSLDCMHWEWKNCPIAWKSQFTTGHGSPTIVLEIAASQDLWIWHAFFGVTSSRNEINVLNESPLFNNVLKGNAPDINFTVNGTQYTKGYYLTNETYPICATFVKSFPCSNELKMKLFEKRQEAARKDVERAFRVLQARWAIVRGPTQSWYKKKLKYILLTCIVLHNMIVEDEGDMIATFPSYEDDELVQYIQGPNAEFRDFLQINSELRNSDVHHQLQHDLVEHIWSQYTNN